MDQAQNDEIDLFSFFKTVWNGKWKIIFFIFISSMASISYLFYTPNSFKVSTELQKSNQDLYHKFNYLNNTLSRLAGIKTDTIENKKLFNNNFEVFYVNNDRIFNMFINEFRDYEEMVTILSQSKYVKNKIKNLNDEEARKSLINFAQNFKLNKLKIKGKGEIWRMSFLWHDVDEGTLLFNSGLNLTLNNVKKSLLKQIDFLANSIDLENKRLKISLDTELRMQRKLNQIMTAKKIRYLKEQSNIAKELGYEKNQLYLQIRSELNFSGGNEEGKSENFEINDYPYYLRGYDAINKEINVINNRSSKENDLMMEGYIEIQKKLLMINSDNNSRELREAKKIIIDDDVSDWVTFNFELAKIENHKKPNLLILISIIIGIIFGTLFVFITSIYKQKNI